MADDYVTKAEVVPYVYQFKEERDGTAIEAIIPRACAIFDTLCEVPRGYFLPRGATDPATARVLYGGGFSFLSLPPYTAPLDSGAVTMPSSYTVPNFLEDDGFLWILDSEGNRVPDNSLLWPYGVPVTVTAKWGYERTPDDVKEAVIELTVAKFRARDRAFLKTVQLDGEQVLSQALPDAVALAVAKYKTPPASVAFV